MKRTNTQKGITLIALIITIIVLLILAIVAIGAVQDDGIIQYAKNARTEYEKAQTNEQTALDEYLTILNENAGSSTSVTTWTQNGTEVRKGTITLTVGDTVNYVSNADALTFDEETYEEITKKYETELGGSWKVLGAEDGRILLMSAQCVNCAWLNGVMSSQDIINAVNTASIGYNDGDGADKTIASRSLKVEDIDRITGYDKTRYREGYVNGYGNKVTYTLGENGTTLTYAVEGKSELNGETTIDPDSWYGFETEKTFKVTNSLYEYTINSTNLFPTNFTYGEDPYPIALNNTYQVGRGIDDVADENFITTGVLGVESSRIIGVELWCSDWGEEVDLPYGIITVVTLESGVVLTESDNAEYDWEISVKTE